MNAARFAVALSAWGAFSLTLMLTVGRNASRPRPARDATTTEGDTE